MDSLIPHSQPWITAADYDAIQDVLSSNMIAQGVRCRALEQRLARWAGAEDGVAVGSGSAALVLALHALGIKSGDEVILPSYVCQSVLEAVLCVEGTPVLCDVGNDWVITADTVMQQVTTKTKAIIAPHMYGIFCDIEAISSLGIPVIEDCAQGVSSESQQRIQGDFAVFSFHPTKCFSSGEGGVVVSKRKELIDCMRTFRDGEKHSLKARLFSPMSDITASLAISQLDRFPQMLLRRKNLADKYLNVLKQARLAKVNHQAFERTMFFRFPVIVDGGIESCEEDFLLSGIQVRRGVDSLLHRTMGLDDDHFQTTVRFFNTTVSLPIYPALNNEQELRCTQAVKKIFTD